MKAIKIIILTGLALVSSFVSYARKDTAKVHTIYKHIVENGKIKPQKFATIQITYNLRDEIIRKVYYDDSSHEISGYDLFFYNNGNLEREEQYAANDSLKLSIEYAYNDKKLKTSEIHSTLFL